MRPASATALIAGSDALPSSSVKWSVELGGSSSARESVTAASARETRTVGAEPADAAAAHDPGGPDPVVVGLEARAVVVVVQVLARRRQPEQAGHEHRQLVAQRRVVCAVQHRVAARREPGPERPLDVGGIGRTGVVVDARRTTAHDPHGGAADRQSDVGAVVGLGRFDEIAEQVDRRPQGVRPGRQPRDVDPLVHEVPRIAVAPADRDATARAGRGARAAGRLPGSARCEGRPATRATGGSCRRSKTRSCCRAGSRASTTGGSSSSAGRDSGCARPRRTRGSRSSRPAGSCRRSGTGSGRGRTRRWGWAGCHGPRTGRRRNCGSRS